MPSIGRDILGWDEMCWRTGLRSLLSDEILVAVNVSKLSSEDGKACMIVADTVPLDEHL